MIRQCVAVPVCLAAFTVAASANAADLVTPTGGKGQFVIDQISGFRASAAPSPSSAFSYAGLVGFAYSKLSFDSLNLGGLSPGGSQSYSYTSFWLAPSLDWFPIDHLSIGGLVEISTTSASRDDKQTAQSPTITTSLPTTTNFTILPRVGYMIPIGGPEGRFAIWPRVGAGYASRQWASPEDVVLGLRVGPRRRLLAQGERDVLLQAVARVRLVAGDGLDDRQQPIHLGQRQRRQLPRSRRHRSVALGTCCIGPARRIGERSHGRAAPYFSGPASRRGVPGWQRSVAAGSRGPKKKAPRAPVVLFAVLEKGVRRWLLGEWKLVQLAR